MNDEILKLLDKEYEKLGENSFSKLNKINIVNNVIEIKLDNLDYVDYIQKISKDIKFFLSSLAVIDDSTPLDYDAIRL